jgi:hypothetical protein
MVWGQHRSVDAGAVTLDGLDLDITVRKPKDDPLEFSITTWNLTEESWQRISDGDLCRIELGWTDGPTETVIIGEIDTRDRSADRGDISYKLAGVDQTEAVTKAKPYDSWGQKAWLNKRPDQIVDAMASEVGLSVQTTRAGSPIQGMWSISPDKTLSGNLDDLLQIAAEKTDVEWEWFAGRGQIYFLPRNQGTQDAPELSYDGLLLSLGAKSDTSDDTEGQLKFEAMLEPRIAKGATVYVNTNSYKGPYRVSDYEFKSSTDSGDHLVRGTLTPIDADYSVE